VDFRAFTALLGGLAWDIAVYYHASGHAKQIVSKPVDRKGDGMPNLVWKKEYAIGIDSIDDQHKAILLVFNSFLLRADADSYATSYRDLGRLIDEHFEHEERIMRKYKLPNSTEHKAWHAKIREDYKNSANDEVNERTIGRMRGRLYTWIVNHILNDEMDRGIAIHLRRMGVYQK